MDFYVWESFNFFKISQIFILRGYNWQFSIGWGNGLVPSDNKPIIWSSVDPLWCHCMALLGCNELKLINGFFIPSALNIDNSCLQARRYDILHMLCREGSYADVSTVWKQWRYCSLAPSQQFAFNQGLFSIYDWARSKLARVWSAVPLGLWSIASSLRENFYVTHLHKFIKWFPDTLYWCHLLQLNSCQNVCDLIDTDVFSDWRIWIELKAISLRSIVTKTCSPMKLCRVVKLPWQASTASCLFDRVGTS